jgi:hypothetical protein
MGALVVIVDLEIWQESDKSKLFAGLVNSFVQCRQND